MAHDLTLRTCGRTGCRWPAAASLSFRYATGQVWLLDLTPEPDPALYDLCPDHADSLTVPRGWERVDQRTTRAVIAEPAGRDLDPLDGGAPPGAGGYGGNRYASLLAALPRLAREHGAAGAGADVGGDRQAGGPPGTAWPTGAPVERSRPPPVASRDLAPMPVESVVDPEAPAPVEGPAGGPAPAPGGGAARDPGAGEAVVVPIDAVSRRRP